MKRGEDAAEKFSASAAAVLFACFAVAAVLTFIGTVVASLVWQRHKRLRDLMPSYNHAAFRAGRRRQPPRSAI